MNEKIFILGASSDFGIDLLKNHIVDRYFRAVSKLNVYNDDKGIDYFFSTSRQIDFDINHYLNLFTFR